VNSIDICEGKAIRNVDAKQSVVPGTGGNLNSFLDKSFSRSYSKMTVREYQKRRLRFWFLSPPVKLLHGLALSNQVPNSGLCIFSVDTGIKSL